MKKCLVEMVNLVFIASLIWFVMEVLLMVCKDGLAEKAKELFFWK